MAFAVGDRARVRLSSAALAAGTLQPQPPLTGLVQDVTGTTITVSFGGAAPSIVVDADFLDQITDTVANIRNAMIDKIVVGITAPVSPDDAADYQSAYTGRVVDVYDVDGGRRVLIQAIENGMFYELPIANVDILGDR
jgi:hypothetical protein